MARPTDVYCEQCSAFVGSNYPEDHNAYLGCTPGFFEADNDSVVTDEFGNVFCDYDCRWEYHQGGRVR